MANQINCFIANSSNNTTIKTINNFSKEEIVKNLYLLTSSHTNKKKSNCDDLIIQYPFSTNTLLKITQKANSEYTLIALKPVFLSPGQFALSRMIEVAEMTNAAMVYADYTIRDNGKFQKHPLIDYQEGSLRDDFDFGPVQLWKTSILKEFSSIATNYIHAGYYALRLFATTKGKIVRIPEFLFSQDETDPRKTGEKIFDYVSATNRDRQIEMEQACTEHLQRIGGFLKPEFKPLDLNLEKFDVEASVIIPVYNRVKTIDDAVNSVLKQKTNFSFNLIVVDNHSNDGTSEALQRFNDDRLSVVTPNRTDLGIGGCWNEGIFNEKCGKFAIQLDSDDIYSDENTLQKIVDKFYDEQCAMVIGSYQLTNFNLDPIPPGIIDHKEWTPDNGRNNALRINGLGAPRAFFTPVIRRIKFPNVSYGEDYAVGLAITREYHIGRIYDPIYTCRRWEENSDAFLDIEKMNSHNIYKDRIRTLELQARIRKNKANKDL